MTSSGPYAPPVPVLTPSEVRYLRRSLGWSQVRFGTFLGRDGATVSRWESGIFQLDSMMSAILYRMWLDVIGPYEGPYGDLSLVMPKETSDTLKKIGAVLLGFGIGHFIVEGYNALRDADDDE